MMTIQWKEKEIALSYFGMQLAEHLRIKNKKFIFPFLKAKSYPNILL